MTVLQDSRVDFIVQELSTRGVDFFIGGSRRFGWFSQFATPDLDIFVHGSQSFDYLRNEWNLHSVTHDEGYPSIHYRTELVGLSIDFIFFTHYKSFARLRDEHQIVEAFLYSLPGKEFFPHLRSAGVTGKQLYRACLWCLKNMGK